MKIFLTYVLKMETHQAKENSYHIKHKIKCSLSLCILEGGRQMLLLTKIISKMTIDHELSFVSQAFEAIFRALTHIGTGMGLDRFLGSKTQI